MKIEDIINLTNGILENSPQIQSIESATVFPSKVEIGDLFISSNEEDIDRAIENGAYAIIYDNDLISKSDSEIAWIKVDNIKDASFRLIRYVILNKDVNFRYLTPHQVSFLKMIITQKSNITILADDWRKAFEQVLNSNEKLFVGSNQKLMGMIKSNMKILDKKVDGYVISDTLFKSTFKIEKYIYQEKELVPFHFDELAKVVKFCQDFELPYSVDRVRYTKHFSPIFIDSDLNKTQSSKSDKVLIFVDNLADIVDAREYIKHNGKWIKSIILTPPKVKIPQIMDNPHWFKDSDEAKTILKSMHFNYALVYTLDKSILNNIKDEYSLF